MARTADETLALAAGPERAVAASKTFVNTLAALALLAAGAAGRSAEIAAGLTQVSEQLASSLATLERAVQPVATAFAYVGRMYVIGRGIEFGTAREIALKLTETCRVAASRLPLRIWRTGRSQRSTRCSRCGRSLRGTRACRLS